jgi:hypothetical protein
MPFHPDYRLAATIPRSTQAATTADTREEVTALARRNCRGNHLEMPPLPGHVGHGMKA